MKRQAVKNVRVYRTRKDASLKSTLINQSMLNDLVRGLTLTKDEAEILGSRLKQWNLLENDTKIFKFQLRHKKLSSFFDVEDNL